MPLVDLRHVNVTLDGHRALKDVSWSLNPGEHWAFIGANGSGKSTLLRVIRGQQWIDPDGGERAYALRRRPRAARSSAARADRLRRTRTAGALRAARTCRSTGAA